MPDSEGDPRTRMIVVAERLFAERGIGAVSLREVGAAAGQRNNSAVQYHFGSKPGLVGAIFDFRQAAIEARREAMLVELDAGGHGDDLPQLVEVLIRPLAEAIVGRHDGESWYARFIAQILANSSDLETPPVLAGSLAEVYGRMDHCLADTLPKRLRRTRLWLAGDFMVNALAERERTMTAPGRDSGLESLSSELFVTELIDMSLAILEAPLSSSSSATASSSKPSPNKSSTNKSSTNKSSTNTSPGRARPGPRTRRGASAHAGEPR